MATWRPPKTSYWVTPPVKAAGGSDFQRIEENTQYLKEQTDGIKSGSTKVGKASNAEYATNAGYANSAGKFIKGEVTLLHAAGPSTPPDSTIIAHNFGSINIIVTVGMKRSYGVISGGGYRIIDSNKVEIFATYDGTMTYVYTILKP